MSHDDDLQLIQSKYTGEWILNQLNPLFELNRLKRVVVLIHTLPDYQNTESDERQSDIIIAPLQPLQVVHYTEQVSFKDRLQMWFSRLPNRVRLLSEFAEKNVMIWKTAHETLLQEIQLIVTTTSLDWRILLSHINSMIVFAQQLSQLTLDLASVVETLGGTVKNRVEIMHEYSQELLLCLIPRLQPIQQKLQELQNMEDQLQAQVQRERRKQLALKRQREEAEWQRLDAIEREEFRVSELQRIKAEAAQMKLPRQGGKDNRPLHEQYANLTLLKRANKNGDMVYCGRRITDGKLVQVEEINLMDDHDPWYLATRKIKFQRFAPDIVRSYQLQSIYPTKENQSLYFAIILVTDWWIKSDLSKMYREMKYMEEIMTGVEFIEHAAADEFQSDDEYMEWVREMLLSLSYTLNLMHESGHLLHQDITMESFVYQERRLYFSKFTEVCKLQHHEDCANDIFALGQLMYELLMRFTPEERPPTEEYQNNPEIASDNINALLETKAGQKNAVMLQIIGHMMNLTDEQPTLLSIVNALQTNNISQLVIL